MREPAARRYKPYPAYKDSGVEWLGEIPAGWEVKPLKHLTTFSTGWTPPTGREDLYGGEHHWANISDLGPKVLQTTEKTISDGAILEARLRIVAAGSLLFSFKLSVGTVSITGADMYTNEAIAAFAPSERIDTQYLYWAAPVLVPRNAQENIYGAPLLSRDRIANARLLSPPVAEQRAIAAFLDQETVRIDALVARKERLVELLQEKRTALITRAVTRGLDPSVPMKDSGVEWLDCYPAHWTALPLKRWVAERITDGPHETPEFVIEGIEFISAEAVSNDKIDFEKRRGFISPELHANYCRKCRPVRDDILMCKSGATTGKLARVEVDHEFSVWSPLAVVRSNRSRILPRFLQVALGSEYIQKQVKRTWSAGTQPNISMGDLELLFVVAPCTDEQAKTLDYLDRDTGGLDALCAHIRDAIERLKELRTALISAAVTGKIDVRGEAA